MYKTITLAALSTLLFMSCEKENIDETITPQKPSTIIETLNESKHRGSDDELILIGDVLTDGGENKLYNGLVKIIDVKTSENVKTIPTNNNGNFETKIVSGDYLLNCYDNNVLIGSSETLRIKSDTKITVVL